MSRMAMLRRSLKKRWGQRRFRVGALVGAVLLMGLVLLRSGDKRIDPKTAHFATVERGDLVISILQSGELQARNRLQILNEAYRDAKIMDMVEDGAFVTNGQLIVELESTELEERYLKQKSQAATAEAELMHAREELEISRLKYAADLESAKLKVELAELELKKYVEAEYPQSVLKAQSDITLAEQELKKAKGTLEGTQELYEKGYANRQDLEADKLGVDRKTIEVRNKTKDLEILQEYTYVKHLKELKNNVANARSALERMEKTYASELLRNQSRLESRETTLEIESSQLVSRELQLKNTKVYADFNGQVFYPEVRWGDRIEKGSTVRYRQAMLSFPDMSEWDIRAGVPESMIDRVALGQRGVATLDAVPGLVLYSTVKKISAVPDSQPFYAAASGVKTYTVVLEVDSDVEIAQLKPGMSATVEIVTERLAEVLYVPIQSVVANEGTHFVYVVKRGRKQLREVEVGKFNNDFIEIASGVEEGEKLLLYAEVEPDIRVPLVDRPIEEQKKLESKAKE